MRRLRYLCDNFVVVWFCLLMPVQWLVGKIISEMTCHLLSGMFELCYCIVTISVTMDSHKFVNIWEVYRLIAGNRQTERLIDLSVMIDWNSWYQFVPLNRRLSLSDVCVMCLSESGTVRLGGNEEGPDQPWDTQFPRRSQSNFTRSFALAVAPVMLC